MSFPRYPKYKDSGVEWLGEVPEHWEIRKLKLVCDVFPSNVDKKSYDGEFPILLCNYTDVYYNEKITAGMDFMRATATRDQIAKFSLRSGDTIITKDSETADDIAVPAYVAEDLPGVVCGYHLSLVRPKRATCGAFVTRFFQCEYAKARFEVLANGLTRVGLGQQELDNVELPFATYEEQVAIAAFLDRETAKIDGLVGEQRRLMELLKEKRQAVISHAVTKGLNPHAPLKPSGIEWLGDVPAHWEVCRVKTVSTFVTSGPRGWSERLGDEGSLFIQSGDLDDLLTIHFTEAKRVRVEADAEASRTRLNDGDVVICVTGAKTGNVAVCTTVPEPAYVNQHLCLIRPIREMHSNFLAVLLKSGVGQTYFEFSQYGLKQGLSLEDVKNAVVLKPPLLEQKIIVSLVQEQASKFDSLTAEAERSIDLLQERRTALISAAVTGKIDVREVIATSLPARKPYTSWFARQLLAAEILHKCHAYPTTGRVKVQKLIHLCEHVAEIEEIHGSYARKAAGPFDHKVMFGIANGLKKLKWFAEEKRQGRTVYRPLERAGDHSKYLARWKDKLPRVHLVLELLGKADTQQCEIVSTLYAAWNDLIIEGKAKAVTDSAIIYEASNPERWHENKALIPADKWPIALQWMRDKGLIPTGFGGRTKRAQPSSSENENGVA